MTNDYTNEKVNEIIEDMEDISENAEVTYEVWGIGYDSEDCVTDAEFLFKTFDKPEDAVEYAKSLTLSDVVQLSAEDNPDLELEYEVAYISIEVETVIDDEDEGAMNVGTIYKNELWVVEEDIQLGSKDYELLEDGTVKIACKLLKNYNKNDVIKILFTDDTSLLTYKIISKVIYEDGDYYHLDFMG